MNQETIRVQAILKLVPGGDKVPEEQTLEYLESCIAADGGEYELNIKITQEIVDAYRRGDIDYLHIWIVPTVYKSPGYVD